MAILLGNGTSYVLALPLRPVHYSHRRLLRFAPSILCSRILYGDIKISVKSSQYRTRAAFQHDDVESSDAKKSEVISEDQNRVSDAAFESIDNKNAGGRSSFLSNLGILLGVAAVITLVLVGIKPPNLGTCSGIQFLQDGGASSLASPTGAFSFRAFGYIVVLPEYAPGWIYFWLLMAAGCGLFISEEALNIWVI